MRRSNGIAVIVLVATSACAATNTPDARSETVDSAHARGMRRPPDAEGRHGGGRRSNERDADANPPATAEEGAARGSRATRDAGALAPCITVHEDARGSRDAVEGRLHGGAPDTPFVLRLARPRCVVGLAGRTFLSEVHVAAAFDLRPLVGARVRVRGEAVGGTSDFGGPAVVFVADDVERILGHETPEPPDGAPPGPSPKPPGP